ncbi:hypothetical protein BDF21DRAFT_190909 [Thamnidium elegans]|nr:hypothetical protein BDF21DRAFT_190909 [Thamnidium elegans]
MKEKMLNIEAFSEGKFFFLFFERERERLILIIIIEIVHKTPLQLYHNAASRLGLDQLNAIKSRLFKQNSTHMILDNLNLAFDQKDLIKPLLQHSTLLQVLDLSSNCLDDQDLKFLLKTAHKGLTELNLRNNILTVECISSILPFPHLRVLDLSYNALGPGILQRLPYLLEKLPSLREIKLSSTRLGDFIKLDQDVNEAYITYAMTSNNSSSIKLDLSSNHFYKDMLCKWTTLWINLNRITRLYLSNISSDTKWDNFQLLSDLPNLSDLIFSFSSKKSLYLCGIKQLITLKSNLNHLDLSCCDLTAEHIEIISQTLKENTTKLGKLTLHCNPRIGDRGIYFLNGAILQSKINMLDISNCGVTNECIPEVVQWTHYVQAIDWSENNLVLSDLEMERINKSANVKSEVRFFFLKKNGTCWKTNRLRLILVMQKKKEKKSHV